MNEQKQPDKGIFDQRGGKIPPRPEQDIPVTQNNTTDQKNESIDITTPKADFKDPFQIQRESIQKSMNHQRKIKEPNYTELMADKVNKAMNPDKGVVENDISPEDLDLAEQMIFRGYAETDVSIPVFKDKKFTICSTSAEELSMLDEVVFNYAKSFERNDGTFDIPQNKISSLRNSLFVAISYRGMNGSELCDAGAYHLNTIKRGIIKVEELLLSGDVEKSNNLKKQVEKSLLYRAAQIRKMATPLIDFLSSEKANFDAKMLRIMSDKDLLPKS